MATAALSPSRALRRSWRIDGRAIVGLFVTLVAVGGSSLYWNQVTAGRDLVVATRELPAGAVLQAGDLGVVRVRATDQLYAAAVPATGLTGLIGKQLGEAVHAQQLLVPAQLSPRPPLSGDNVATTVPVSPATAAGGRIHPGDDVRVLVAVSKGKPDHHTDVVLDRARVYDVGYDHSAVAASGADQSAPGAISWVTLIVSSADLQKLSDARWNGDIELDLVPPASAGSG